MVDSTWEICNRLDEVYGTSASNSSKKLVTPATEESQCATLKFFTDIDITPGEDRSLIATCTEVVYWCCCEIIKKGLSDHSGSNY